MRSPPLVLVAALPFLLAAAACGVNPVVPDPPPPPPVEFPETGMTTDGPVQPSAWPPPPGGFDRDDPPVSVWPPGREEPIWADEKLPAPTAPAPSVSISTLDRRDRFSDGVWLVGEDIEPGVYRARPPGKTCYWSRLDSDGTVTRDNKAAGEAVVLILDSDTAFESSGCGTWQKVP
ncbi:MAG: hypothetical protein OXG37_03580 [Actinomycetia bacterium]|nr:hypothetical protein [Actinomycetes bacterium]